MPDILKPTLPESGLLATEEGPNRVFFIELLKYAKDLEETWPKTEAYAKARTFIRNLAYEAAKYGECVANVEDPLKHEETIKHEKTIKTVGNRLPEIQDENVREQISEFLKVVNLSVTSTKIRMIANEESKTLNETRPEVDGTSTFTHTQPRTPRPGKKESGLGPG